ncbi:Hypothetical predicted protein [Cloeon dipterum]|uniref:Uncharacterized protein n=1 Tax=Cloeon dipterum TaxID=197152 RepID=A0A8S1CJB4_9INSE|nr:Hypothetical predicted protein [Cloeon dipterum]
MWVSAVKVATGKAPAVKAVTTGGHGRGKVGGHGQSQGGPYRRWPLPPVKATTGIVYVYTGCHSHYHGQGCHYWRLAEAATTGGYGQSSNYRRRPQLAATGKAATIGCHGHYQRSGQQ